MKQTAVEWFVEQLKEYDFAHIKDDENYIIKLPAWVLAEKQQQAKAMEKEQQKIFFDCGRQFQLIGEGTFSQVHNEIFNKKQ